MAVADEPLTYEAVFERDGVKVSKSPWGPDDEIGRLNWMTPESQRAILDRLNGTKVFATAGAQIVEVLRLDELAAEQQYEVAFLAFPLKLAGATGVPVRPVAVPLR